MPVDLGDKKKDSEIDPQTQKSDWRPPVGTRVLIVKHGSWKNHAGVVEEHQRWMGMNTISVKMDGQENRAGITAPDQIKILGNE